MLDLIPTLFAQQQVKQAAVPVPPIEPASLTQAKSTTPVVAPTPAIASPEPAPISIAPPPAPVIVETIPVKSSPAPLTQPLTASSQPIGSAVVLPKPPQAIETKTKPVSKQVSTTPTKLTEKPTSNTAASAVSRPTASPTPIATESNPATPATQTAIEIPVPKPNPQTPLQSSTQQQKQAPSTAQTAIEIPVPKPNTQTPLQSSTQEQKQVTPAAQTAIEIPVAKPSTQTTSQSPTQQQKQLLEQRLADIVTKDRAVKQAQQRDALVGRAYSFATQRRFAQARKLLQDPSIPTDVRDQILSNINSLESASRAIGVTQLKEPPVKPTTTAKKPATKSPAVITRATKAARSPQKVVTIQVPRAIESLPIQRQAPISDPTVSVASDSAGGYIDQLVPPKNLQAYNRNLPKLNSRDQIVYPLPEAVPVTSRFGWRRHPVTGVRRFHAGVDLGAGQGTPVIASRGGKVVSADRLGGYGLAVVMQQPDGSQDTLYAHLSQILVRPGEKIQPGTIIGRVGSTGLSTGPHLHYEARRMTNTGWTPVDPGGQLEAARVRLVQAQRDNTQSAEPSGNSWKQSASINRSQYVE